MGSLKRIQLKGFRSIKEMDLELRALNVLIGANGSGKSNLISFFKMLNEMMGRRLQQYIATSGRAQSILYFGPRVTPEIETLLEFNATNERTDSYFFKLSFGARDTLLLTEETIELGKDRDQEDYNRLSGGSGAESFIPDALTLGRPAAKAMWCLLNQCRVYHFHDTSPQARVRQYGYVADSKLLHYDAANLAAVLYRLKNERTIAYSRIVETIRLIAPFFVDFDLDPVGPNRSEIMLNWRHSGSDLLFGPHQISDGTLRAMCLIALLLQPEDERPSLIVVDEPELGLHPYALSIVASLFQSASLTGQVLISTQSSAFLNHFELDDIIVAEREGDRSVFRRLDADNLKDWLEEYSLGEVWEKNVIGGGPH